MDPAAFFFKLHKYSIFIHASGPVYPGPTLQRSYTLITESCFYIRSEDDMIQTATNEELTHKFIFERRTLL